MTLRQSNISCLEKSHESLLCGGTDAQKSYEKYLSKYATIIIFNLFKKHNMRETLKRLYKDMMQNAMMTT